jgi:formate/nitrite transporter
MGINNPVQMVEAAGNAGKVKGELPIAQLLVRGFMAGAYIAVGAALCTVCSTAVAPHLGAGIGKLVAGAVFPVGLIAIVLTGMELFTGDAMLVPMAALQGKSTWGKVLNNWIWVYIGNLIGSLAYAYLMVNGPFTQGNFGAAEPGAFGLTAVSLAVGKTLTYKAADAGMWSVFLNGIGCNFLVNIAILMGIVAKDFIGKFFGIWFPIMAFVSTGFEHCVANMYFLPAGLWVTQKFPGLVDKTTGDGQFWNPLLHANGGLSWGDVWLWNLIPVTIGNIVGGMIFIGFVYYFCFRKDLPSASASSGAPVSK